MTFDCLRIARAVSCSPSSHISSVTCSYASSSTFLGSRSFANCGSTASHLPCVISRLNASTSSIAFNDVFVSADSAACVASSPDSFAHCSMIFTTSVASTSSVSSAPAMDAIEDVDRARRALGRVARARTSKTRAMRRAMRLRSTAPEIRRRRAPSAFASTHTATRTSARATRRERDERGHRCLAPSSPPPRTCFTTTPRLESTRRARAWWRFKSGSPNARWSC